MYEKLTYSGTESNNYLYFALYAECFDVDLVTKGLMIEPTSTSIKKYPVPVSTYWCYRIDAGTEINLEVYLDKLIDIFEEKINDINKLKERYKLESKIQFVVDVDINPELSTPTFGIDKRVVSFLYSTGTIIDYDLYKVDSIGLLNSLDEK